MSIPIVYTIKTTSEIIELVANNLVIHNSGTYVFTRKENNEDVIVFAINLRDVFCIYSQFAVLNKNKGV